MDLLRVATAGSVDDGKSTLIGRLLYDSKQIFEDQLDAVERAEHPAGPRLHEPGPAHRRPAGRARAGHHHRRRLPLLRHRPAQVHHRRHPRPRAVHPQHGHGRLDRRRGRRAGRRPQGPARAVPPPRLHRHPAADPPHRGVRQQDGPRRLGRGRLRAHPATSSGPSPPASRSPTCQLHPRLRPARRQRGRPVRATCPGTGGCPCSSTSRSCTSRPTAT